jgi:uncharacterized protein YyaL (SSP411 family)
MKPIPCALLVAGALALPLSSSQQFQFTNHLAGQKSPYLLQHAHNPVDWYPWSEAAFVRARDENKPIFLSIGYSTCHWCHVMEAESFSDAAVGELMNATFISIKVDREERPDIDSVYMRVSQLLTGGGGWPLTILMTPEKEPRPFTKAQTAIHDRATAYVYTNYTCKLPTNDPSAMMKLVMALPTPTGSQMRRR